MYGGVLATIFQRSAEILAIPRVRFPFVDCIRPTSSGSVAFATCDSNSPHPPEHRPHSFFVQAHRPFRDQTPPPLGHIGLKSSGVYVYSGIIEMYFSSSRRLQIALSCSGIQTMVGIRRADARCPLLSISSPGGSSPFCFLHQSPPPISKGVEYGPPAPPAFLSSTAIRSGSPDGAHVYQPAELVYKRRI